MDEETRELPTNDKDRRVLPPEYSDPTRYTVASNGAIRDIKTGRIVTTPGGGKYAIAPTNSSELRSLWKAQKARAKLRGMVRGMLDADGKQIDVSDIDDELIMQANSAAEALTAHMVRTFLTSNNLRGMGETYTKLMELDENAQDSGPAQAAASAVADLAAAIRAIAERQERQAVEGTVIDAE